MKMVTKTFQKTSKMSSCDIENIVTAALGEKYHFLYSGVICDVQCGLQRRARCNSPRALNEAWLRNKAITFSITLPARYWK